VASVSGRLLALERRWPRGHPAGWVGIRAGTDAGGRRRATLALRSALGDPSGVVIDFGEGGSYKRGLAALRAELGGAPAGDGSRPDPTPPYIIPPVFRPLAGWCQAGGLCRPPPIWQDNGAYPATLSIRRLKVNSEWCRECPLSDPGRG
jgi:hypothetical protein